VAVNDSVAVAPPTRGIPLAGAALTVPGSRMSRGTRTSRALAGPSPSPSPSPSRRGRAIEALIGERLLRTFSGSEPTPELLAAIRAGRAAGVTLFRAKNMASPEQLRVLSAALQAARPADGPALIIALDQEGGQLQALGDGATDWPGNLALAATGSADLARRAGRAIGTELAAIGVNVEYAPVCDLLDDPRSPVMGTRTFGDEPVLAGRLAAAMVRGIQSAGVAATLKHFPGHGSVAGDSHHGLPVSPIDTATLRSRELVPFRAGIRAGARLVMLGHLAVPAATSGRAVPATLAPELARDLLRDELGFGGVSITDALDMGALYVDEAGVSAPATLATIALRAVEAGVDLLLTLHSTELEDRTFEVLVEAARDGRLDGAELRAAAGRVRRLRRWIGRVHRPPLAVVGSAAHLSLAREIGERSATLLRDRERLVPLRPGAGLRLVVVTPRPVDLTPADTSSYLSLGLADSLRSVGLRVDEIVMPIDPAAADVAAIRAAVGAIVAEAAATEARSAGATGSAGATDSAGRVVAVVGTIDALVHTGQARIADELVAAGMPVIGIALRTPVDCVAHPSVGTAVGTYGSQPPNLHAVAAALVGRIPFRGRLPIRLPMAVAGDAR
jgi:beta-N-acetylhexosaminidase